MNPRAVIADDERRLADHLAARLAVLWPDLTVCGVVTNGADALGLINREKPDVAFLDIQMPGLTGMDVVRRMTHRALVVFVTAYDRYAVESFEQEAVDYLLKPVNDERLARAIERVRKRLGGTEQQPGLEALLRKLNGALAPKASYAGFLRAAAGTETRLIPVETILFIQARSKYTAVVTRDGEFLMRTPLKELLTQLDPERFWQIHRSTIVNLSKVRSIRKAEQQQYVLSLFDSPETLTASRQFAHLFNQF